MNSQWGRSYLKFLSVFRPTPTIEVLVKNGACFWAPRGYSHGPPSSEALADGLVQRLAQSSRLRVGAAANPFCGIHGLRIVGLRQSSNCRQDAFDGFVSDFWAPSKPARC